MCGYYEMDSSGCIPTREVPSVSLRNHATESVPVVNQADSFLHCPFVERLSNLGLRLPSALVVKQMPDPIKHGRVRQVLLQFGQASVRFVVDESSNHAVAGVLYRVCHGMGFQNCLELDEGSVHLAEFHSELGAFGLNHLHQP